MEDEKKTPGAEGALTQEEIDNLVKEKAQLAQDKANLVNEIKGLREKNQLTEKEKADLATKVDELSKLATPGEQDDIKTVAERVTNEILSKREKEVRDSAFKTAIEEFKKSNPEYSDSNDPAGIKFSTLLGKVNTYNLDLFKTKEQFTQLFGEANMILNPKRVVEDDDEGYGEGIQTPSSGAKQPKVVENTTLSPKEEKLVNGNFYKGDKEKFLKDKAKKPDFIESLLEYVR